MPHSHPATVTEDIATEQASMRGLLGSTGKEILEVAEGVECRCYEVVPSILPCSCQNQLMDELHAELGWQLVRDGLHSLTQSMSMDEAHFCACSCIWAQSLLSCGCDFSITPLMPQADPIYQPHTKPGAPLLTLKCWRALTLWTPPQQITLGKFGKEMILQMIMQFGQMAAASEPALSREAQLQVKPTLIFHAGVPPGMSHLHQPCHSPLLELSSYTALLYIPRAVPNTLTNMETGVFWPYRWPGQQPHLPADVASFLK